MTVARPISRKGIDLIMMMNCIVMMKKGVNAVRSCARAAMFAKMICV